MPNSREHDHLVSSKFLVEIDGLTVAAFSSASGLESETEVIEYRNGNDLHVRKRPGRTTYANVVLKRGMTLGSIDLWNWYKAVRDGQVQRRSVSIIVLGDDGSEKLRYNLFEAWPCRWKSLELSGTSQETLIEEIELAVERFERG
jgi:phage tail-like protein